MIKTDYTDLNIITNFTSDELQEFIDHKHKMSDIVDLDFSNADITFVPGATAEEAAQIKTNQSDITFLKTSKADKETVSQINNRLENNINNMELKANQSDLDITNKNVAANAEAIKLKANKTDLDILSGTAQSNFLLINNQISTLTDKQSDNAKNITANTDLIKSKADNILVLALSDKINANISDIDTLKNSIGDIGNILDNINGAIIE